MRERYYLKKLSGILFRVPVFGLIGLYILNFTAPVLNAHPHVFIVQRINVVFDDKGLAGFKLRWGFDDMFASMIVGDHDRNQNGRLEPEEVKTIEEKAFSYIADYDYFTFVKIDKKPFQVKYVKDFKAILEGTKLVYEFFIPCHVRAIKQSKEVTVATYDPSYYTAIFFAQNQPASLTLSEPYEVKTAIREDPSTSIYYDMVHPWALFLEFRLKR